MAGCGSEYLSSMQRNVDRMIAVHPSIKKDPILKITKIKRADGMTQVIEHLPSKCKALSSNFITTKKKKSFLK
jgi:hypothetical protein